MTLPTDEVPPPSSSSSTALVPISNEVHDATLACASQSDLKLQLLQTFAAYVSQKLVDSYVTVKYASRVTRYIANTTELLAARSGLMTFGRILLNQYTKHGRSLVQQVDDRMGKFVIDGVVRVLMLAKQQPAPHPKQRGILALETEPLNSKRDGNLREATKLSFAERFQALLLGEVPRMEQIVVNARRQAEADARAKAVEEARLALPPVVMELKEFVPIDEVARLKEESKAEVLEAGKATASLCAEISDLKREKQQLEQRLSDVYNFQETDRGQRFKQMEEELACVKLDRFQKAEDLRKLELIMEASQRDHKKKGKSRRGKKQSNTSTSAMPSPSVEKSSEKAHVR
ncbi:hypothetical protein CCR75_004091 [Bremia lactucae]|uniref:Uncharacterized protein n=1 Tax=Bremia lactucae TaxID=4779 RepID=A0A976NZ19_BRELC|nr:hypothetical protein CCR75_004091 [Bremia lactucae]